MLKKLLTDALDIVKNNRRLYFTLNGLYYGLIIVGLVYTQFDRSVQNTLMQGLNTTYGSGGPLSSVLDAYTNGKIVQAIAVTFGINLVVGSFASVTLPSLIVPFLGLAVAIYRAALWGIIYSPAPGVALTGPNIGFGLFVAGLFLLEGQGYVLTILAAVLQGRALLSPKSIGEESRWRAYLAGLKLTGKLYLLVTITLFISAIYEVASVLFIPG
jgi:hypothetical protein